jgi:hypothetical protein
MAVEAYDFAIQHRRLGTEFSGKSFGQRRE